MITRSIVCLNLLAATAAFTLCAGSSIGALAANEDESPTAAAHIKHDHPAIDGEQAEAHAIEIITNVVFADADPTRGSGRPAHGAVVVTSLGGRGVTDAHGVARFIVEVCPNSHGHAATETIRATAVATVNGVNYVGSVPIAIDQAVDSHAINHSPHSPRRGETIQGEMLTFDVGVITLTAGGDCKPSWLPTFGGEPGVNSYVNALTVFDDGSGPALYVGGLFTTAGGVEANRVARWDGQQWSPLGTGMNQTVLALAVFDDGNGPALYAGGNFTIAGGMEANHIARWDGQQWSTVGGGVSDLVITLTVIDDDFGLGPALYAGGRFTAADGVDANRIARWDGHQWSALGDGMNERVFTLTVFDDGSGSGPALYAGGYFTAAGGIEANRIAKWDGQQWSALGSGMDYRVDALTVFDDGTGPALYAGGGFTIAGKVEANRIAKWNGKQWAPLGAGVGTLSGDTVHDLMVFDDGTGLALYASGNFNSASGVPVNLIAKWDGQQWSALGSVIGTWVSTLAIFDDGSGPGLYAGGNLFAVPNSVRVNNVAKWDGQQWSALGSGMNRHVSALAVFDDGSGGGPALFVGGNFTAVGEVIASSVTKWDGEQWSALGSGVNGLVHALTVFDDGSGTGPALFAGGTFTIAGGVTVNRIAKWDGQHWSALGSGIAGDSTTVVRALTVYDYGAGPVLVAGGNFVSAGGVTVNRIARWNGQAWAGLTGGVGGSHGAIVFSLIVFDDGLGPALFVGGNFSNAGGVPVNHIAKWIGPNLHWSALGGGMNGEVRSMSIFDDGSGTGPALYAGGQFTAAGGVTVNRIARWNGQQWSALGSGISGGTLPRVDALMVFDDGSASGPALYAGGWFTVAGGVEANRIAKWDGQQWSALGNGMSDLVLALAVFDDGTGPALYAGGAFPVSPAGDSYLAKWGGCPAAPECGIADLNCDGVVNVADLRLLFDAWGACADCDDCPADLNGDCVVNVSDLLILFDHWGPV